MHGRPGATSQVGGDSGGRERKSGPGVVSSVGGQGFVGSLFIGEFEREKR